MKRSLPLFLSALLVFSIVMSSAPVAYAAGEPFEVHNPCYTDYEGGIWGEETAQVASMEEVLEVVNGTSNIWFTFLFPDFVTVDETAPVVIRLKKTDNTTAIDQPLNITNRIYRFELAAAVDQSITSFVQKSEITEKISVGEGGVLVLCGGDTTTVTYNGAGDVTVKVPIEVNSGGAVYLDRTFQSRAAADKYTAGGDHPIFKVTSGGTLHVGAVDFVVNGNQPAIEVSAGGNVVFYETTTGTFTTPGSYGTIPDFNNPGGSAAAQKDAKADSTGAAIIEVAEGAKLTLRGGKFSNTGESPAIKISEGATLEIPKGSIATVTTSADNGQAIDLAGGAIIRQGDQKITAASAEDGGAADNYVDNHGNIILAKGAKIGDGEGDLLNAAVILPDGTIIEGTADTTELKPTYDETTGKTIVSIPAGGKVTNPQGTITHMTAGGTASRDETGTTVEKTEIKATGLTLNQTGVTLYSNTTPNTVQLTATVTPENSTDTVTWASDSDTVATVDENGLVTAVDNGTATITATAGEVSATCQVTVTRRNSGGGSSTTTTTQKNEDGSTTTTVTNKRTGTVTATTKYEDGSTLVVESKKDGTVTTTETTPDKVVVKTVDVPEEAVTAAVTLPEDVETATVTVPAALTPGTVAVDVKTGEIVKLSVPTENGMLIKVEGSVELVLEDRSRDFVDTVDHWAEDAVDFAVAHEMFYGTSETTFSPESPMTRAMLMTVLARFDGQDTAGGATWYEKGMEWAKQSGVSDGTNPNGSITREQLATMLYRYVGEPAVEGDLEGFTDADAVSDYAANAMKWAVSTGIIGGMGDGTLAPQGDATRAQVATMLTRFVTNLTK